MKSMHKFTGTRSLCQTIRVSFLFSWALISGRAFLFVPLQKVNSLFNLLGILLQVTLCLAVIPFEEDAYFWNMQ